MNEIIENEVPVSVISKSRGYDDVLAEYQRILESAQAAAKASGEIQESIFLHATMTAAYRIYLLGVEDGMKEAAK